MKNKGLIIGLVVLLLLGGGGTAWYLLQGDQPAVTADASGAETIDNGERHTMGNPNAPVTLIEYAALACPHCAEFNELVMPALKSKYIDTGKVYYVFRLLPISPAEQERFRAYTDSGETIGRIELGHTRSDALSFNASLEAAANFLQGDARLEEDGVEVALPGSRARVEEFCVNQIAGRNARHESERGHHRTRPERPRKQNAMLAMPVTSLPFGRDFSPEKPM